jgi:hypothetical protein
MNIDCLRQVHTIYFTVWKIFLDRFKTMCPVVNEKSAPQHVKEYKEWRIREWGMESESQTEAKCCGEPNLSSASPLGGAGVSDF